MICICNYFFAMIKINEVTNEKISKNSYFIKKNLHTNPKRYLNILTLFAKSKNNIGQHPKAILEKRKLNKKKTFISRQTMFELRL